MTLFFPACGGEPTIAAIEALRSGWQGPEPLRLLGSDTDADKRAVVAVDQFWTSPRRDDPVYVEFLSDRCLEEGVDILWPNPTEEQLFFSRNRARFESLGVALLLPPQEALEVLADKSRTYERAASLGMRVPQWKPVANWSELCAAAEAFGYPQRPVVFRRTSGKGGIGLRVLSEDPHDLGDLFTQQPSGLVIPLTALRSWLKAHPRWPSCMVCEYLSGREFDVDCLGSAGTLLTAIPRRNDAMWWGTSARAETVDRPDLVEACRRLLGSLGWQYICSVTFREDAEGRPALLEVNTRMPACINLSWRAGYNLPLAALHLLLGRDLPPFTPPIWGVRLIRFFGESYLMP
ncbi:MAG: ATP-grasp domain-containing protein [Isosphaeraceae bacterium]|nr:ATP-grasp domain-containing protein [Isosphaeraceae bacterium]